MNTAELAQFLVTTLDDSKALQITDLNVTALTDITDHMIICSATSRRHASALADKITTLAKQHDHQPLGVEGAEQSEWILIDLNTVIVHIMLPEMRDFYSLEKLWDAAATNRNNETESH